MPALDTVAGVDAAASVSFLHSSLWLDRLARQWTPWHFFLVTVCDLQAPHAPRVRAFLAARGAQSHVVKHAAERHDGSIASIGGWCELAV